MLRGRIAKCVLWKVISFDMLATSTASESTVKLIEVELAWSKEFQWRVCLSRSNFLKSQDVVHKNSSSDFHIDRTQTDTGLTGMILLPRLLRRRSQWDRNSALDTATSREKLAFVW